MVLHFDVREPLRDRSPRPLADTFSHVRSQNAAFRQGREGIDLRQRAQLVKVADGAEMKERRPESPA